MEPHVFPKGLRVNTVEYLKVMSEVVEPWMRQVANGRTYVWQQDGTPAHTAKKTQEWCKDNLPQFWEKELWSPSSPDCNPLDYFVWSVTERDVNKFSHNTRASLIAKIIEVFRLLPRQHVINACARFRSRIEAVIQAEGGFIRQSLENQLSFFY